MTVQHGRTFHEQIASNRRRSFLLLLIVAVVLGGFGFLIGYVLTESLEGGYIAVAIALVVALLLSAGSWFA
ncbi:MAG TPA: hypothetical protein VNW68_08325, partial [Candidatus Limnocylindria bacterium]|nr:hypothetical protein [Candidatus Limnocylindria bacterium]